MAAYCRIMVRYLILATVLLLLVLISLTVNQGFINSRIFINELPNLPAPEPLHLPRHSKYLAAMVHENQDIINDLPPSGFLSEYRNFCWRDYRESILRCVPSVYIAGFVKCGTTDLYSKLVWHEDLLQPPAGKENMFWPRTRIGRRAGLYIKTPRPRETFKTFTTRMTLKDMDNRTEGLIVDGTPCLISEQIGWEQRYPWASHPPYTNADLIRYITPDAKIIAIVRDPVERLWSDFLYFDQGEKRTPEMFARDVAKEIERFTLCLETRDLRYCCYSDQNSLRVELSLGIYICFIQDWWENFGDNLLILTLENYHNNQLGTLLDVFDFIGVSVDKDDLGRFLKSSQIENERTKSSKIQGDMLAETRLKLRDFYQPYNLMLARYLQDNKYLWGY